MGRGIQWLSVKKLTSGILLALGVFTLLISYVGGTFFREAALASHATSLSKVLEVAVADVLGRVHMQAMKLGFAVGQDQGLAQAVARGNINPVLQDLLDDPFVMGFVGADVIDLAKLRVYDMTLEPIAESRHGRRLGAHRIPAFLRRTAMARTGADRLKALGGLWRALDGFFYSVLVPVGGLRQVGYLEVVVALEYNLKNVAQLPSMPIAVATIDRPVPSALHGGKRLPVEYLLRTQEGEPAYRIVGLADVAPLYRDIRKVQLLITSEFVGLTVLSLLLALWLFRHLLFRPVQAMMDDIEAIRHGDLERAVDRQGLREFARLADAFNAMTKEVRDRARELERLSNHDPLTEIANRRKFDAILQQEFGRARRAQTFLTLLFIDIDFFKRYNDTYGHQAGDTCLRAVADAIRAVLRRPGDLVARYGGEEFAVILPQTTREGAQVVALRIQEAVDALRIQHAGSDVSDCLTLSIGGLSRIPRHGEQPEAFVAEVDDVLYRAKQEGRNRLLVNPAPTTRR